MADRLLTKSLDPMGYPVRLQGSFIKGSYPDHFFTFWNNSADGDSFYNDNENAIVWDFSLNFYSIDPEKVNTVFLEAKKLLRAAGFVVTGAGYSVVSDEPTHTGRGISVRYRQELKQE